MATVHRAFDRRERRWVAVKLLAPALARHRAARQRLAREAEVLSQLAHPNVVRIYRLEQTPALTWLVMELIEGKTIAHWSQAHGPMPARLAVEVLLQICDAVRAAHEAGVIHRDLKPSNVLIDATGRCRVVDFGLARGPDSAPLTRTGMTMGTYGFMAPEQQSDAKGVGVSADIYSLGATLLAMLIGRPPSQLHDGLSAVSATLPLSLSRTLVRTTLPRPADRHASVDHLRRALLNTLAELPPLPADTPALHIPLSSGVRSSASPTLIEAHPTLGPEE